MMCLRTCISIGLLASWPAAIAMAAGLKGWEIGHQKSGEASGAACTVGGRFTLSGFPGNSSHDGCYMNSRSNHDRPLYTRNGQHESRGGLMVSTPEHDDSAYLVYWTVEDRGNIVCGGSKFRESVIEAHPTYVSNWKCYGGSKKDRELPVKATLSLSCGCPTKGEEMMHARGLDIFLFASFAVALSAFSMRCCLRRTLRRYFKPLDSEK